MRCPMRHGHEAGEYYLSELIMALVVWCAWTWGGQ
jgi:hypothetical protein